MILLKSNLLLTKRKFLPKSYGHYYYDATYKFNSDIEEYQTLDEKLEAEISGDSIKVSIGNTGEGKPINIEPQYYTMIFIMKLWF